MTDDANGAASEKELGGEREGGSVDLPLMHMRIDHTVHAAYIRIPHAKEASRIAHTITDVTCNIDISDTGLVYGIEILGWPVEPYRPTTQGPTP